MRQPASIFELTLKNAYRILLSVFANQRIYYCTYLPDVIGLFTSAKEIMFSSALVGGNIYNGRSNILMFNHPFKRSFHRVINDIFRIIGRLASEEVILDNFLIIISYNFGLKKTNVCHVCCVDWNVIICQKVL